MKEHNKNHII
ncbi:Protein of unknown function [Bacillus toyonensis]|nr:Protein of unknown function [Bacillus toyonensis]